MVIGEPQRASYGAQFSDTFPVLQHFGVDLWVPDVGGRIDPDPDSDVHELRMTIIGGISKGERRRSQRRVIGAMEAATVNQGRFLGGRPPYGYIVVSAGPHPNPSKAADGIALHVLEAEPVTAPVVQRIFDLYLGGTGLRAVAARLNTEGLPCRSKYDPNRNTSSLIQVLTTAESAPWAKAASNWSSPCSESVRPRVIPPRARPRLPEEAQRALPCRVPAILARPVGFDHAANPGILVAR